MKINLDNVEELWELYENYKDNFYKTHYSDVKCDNFETFVDTEVIQCSNCGRYITSDGLGTNELAITDTICENCMQDGYGA